MLSLRARFLFGAVLWSLGLFLVIGEFITGIMFRHPSAPRFFHELFTHVTMVTIVSVLCLVIGFFQVQRGLAAVRQIRSRLAAIHAGRERTLEGTYPAEVQPLVNDLNVLLDHRDRAVRRALTKAGDLAHGLKTPLAVLSQEAERAAAAGQGELATAIGQQVERMRRQIDYHLAHARAAASGATPGAHCPVAESADGLARTLSRLHADRGLAIDLRVSPEHAVRAEREDLDEMLGNLLDNACKWAKSRVTLTSSRNHDSVEIVVEDDGPGLEASMWEKVLQRGVRADEAAPGSGMGLAIVRELAELYGGSVSLGRSAVGGVSARLRLPAQ